MIVRDKPGLWSLLFAMRGSVLPKILPHILGFAAYSAILVAVDHLVYPLPHLDGAAFTVFGIALSLFLGFRNNAAYDRWWEARKLWGGLLADIRSLTREAEISVPDPGARARILRLALAFAHLHRLNLRRLPLDEAAANWGGAALSRAPHPPCAALDAIGAEVARGVREGTIDGFGARTLATRLGSMALNQAGCERILSTPLPYVYSLLIFRTVYVYCLLLPLVLVGPAGWVAPLLSAIVAYVFFGLAEVTEELAHPFTITGNGLPLDAICRAAEIAVSPHLGEPAPAPLAPVNFYLG